jgi:hypothetical protein
MLGHLGSGKVRVNSEKQIHGRMGHGLTRINTSTDRMPQFVRGLQHRLGSTPKKPSTVTLPSQPPRSFAPAPTMANRGGGNPGRGRPPGGRGGTGWQDGFGGGRGSNFFEGGLAELWAMEGMLATVLATKRMCLAMGCSELAMDGRIMAGIDDISRGSTITMIVAIPTIMVTIIPVGLFQIRIPTPGLRVEGMLLLFLVFQKRNRDWFRRRQRRLRGSLLARQNS